MAFLAGILQSLIASLSWALGKVGLQKLVGDRIRITQPQPLGELTNPKALGSEKSYLVRGTLKRLPPGHTIWLLTQDDRNGRIWPQGFELVQYDQARGEWSGRIDDGRNRLTRIIAVVAPPTSHAFFSYFQAHGVKTGYAPLLQVPPECINRDEVQAHVP